MYQFSKLRSILTVAVRAVDVQDMFSVVERFSGRNIYTLDRICRLSFAEYVIFRYEYDISVRKLLELLFALRLSTSMVLEWYLAL